MGVQKKFGGSVLSAITHMIQGYITEQKVGAVDIALEKRHQRKIT